MGQKDDARHSIEQARERMSLLLAELSRRASLAYVTAKAKEKAMEKTYELKEKAFEKGQNLKHRAAEKAVEIKDRVKANPNVLAYFVGGLGLATAATIFLIRQISPKKTFAMRQMDRIRPAAKRANEMQKLVVDEYVTRFDRDPYLTGAASFGVLSAILLPFLLFRRGSAVKELKKLAKDELRSYAKQLAD